ncbi:hypothetical protein [Oerskovia flava]|uniref:hypothetical protein n=1 Tax=Oerskovia flava TaxID=2986422 RepID=UPI00223F2067|nr:hypothetical protein [Oerskovia sp. JB1-3-2]
MTTIDAKVARILDAATQAPSILNTQPWRAVATGDSIQVRADSSRGLPHLDPAARELHVSCGAFLLNLRIAARRESFDPRVELLPDAADPALLAVIDLYPGLRPTADELELAVAVPRRRTARVPLDDEPLAVDVLDELTQTVFDEHALVRVLPTDGPQRRSVLALLRETEAEIARDKVARAEEGRWTDAARPRRGVAAFEPRTTVAILTTPGDSPRDWLVAGQALERLLLTATVYAVRASFATAALEDPVTRHELRTLAGLVGFPQVVLGLGHSRLGDSTPRRSVGDVLTGA